MQTDGGSMFIAGMSGITEPPVLDLWTVHGEEDKLQEYIEEDSRIFMAHEDIMHHYHLLQIDDFLKAILEDGQPLITLEDGRKTVELFTAIYRSQRDRMPIRFPLKPEHAGDMDGRI